MSNVKTDEGNVTSKNQ